MDGVGGKPGWAWIFILEGIFTVLCAIASFWILADFPDSAKFLTETERVWVVRRLQSDSKFSAGGEIFKMKHVWDSLTDWKTWVASFQATAANLLSVPVYAWACLVTLAVGVLGDRIGHRGYINLVLFGSGAYNLSAALGISDGKVYQA
ncbi:hypothetical protein PHLCEN_2v8826 [Hermanssonia centrifuga]|uniref:Major facilitator superfamily (MFS) profile domain-containing protein n=1 Tax=Hermanssonia centrifuga TaxID=98765 RepID=A0A2R6NSM7_9APHY|nr:hypothetical protein PHLCEN_2v8826 [Hermanssonia centrifuga]